MTISISLDYNQYLEMRVHLQAARRHYLSMIETKSRFLSREDTEFLREKIHEVDDILLSITEYNKVEED